MANVNINTVFVTYMWNLKNNTNECIYKIETVTDKTNFWLPQGREKYEGTNQGYGIK